MPPASDFLDRLTRTGRFHFTTDEAARSMGRSLNATRAALQRLASRGLIAQPQRSFHVIVPPEYRALGCLPAAQFVPQLFEHLDETYYVALLTAAEIHGAAHQRPQRFQVMCATRRRAIHCGAVEVEFMLRNNLDRTATMQVNTPRGLLRVASREATALELIGYASRCGGLDHVVAVIDELGTDCDSQLLVDEAQKAPIVWAQRLGYILDSLHENNQVTPHLAAWIAERRPVYAPLSRPIPRAAAPKDRRWRLVINVDLQFQP